MSDRGKWDGFAERAEGIDAGITEAICEHNPHGRDACEAEGFYLLCEVLGAADAREAIDALRRLMGDGDE